MSYLLSVDPGLRKSGAALWHDGELLAAKLIESKSEAKEIPILVEMMTRLICSIGAPHPDGQRGLLGLARDGLQLVCERPRTYSGRAGRGDANDLIAVALVVGALLGRLSCPTALPLPEEWKGGIPKPKTKVEYLRDGYPVEERVRAKLSPVEAARVEWPRDWRKKMDVSDALGIGLYALGRKL